MSLRQVPSQVCFVRTLPKLRRFGGRAVEVEAALRDSQTAPVGIPPSLRSFFEFLNYSSIDLNHLSTGTLLLLGNFNT
jgi:hypothetical protein